MIAAGVKEDVVVELSEDLIIEILSRLPPISLLRFKSVSKTWYSLVSNPDFLRRNTTTQFDRRRRWYCINTQFDRRRRWYCINDTLPPPPSILLNRNVFAGYDQSYIYYSHFHQKVSPLLLQKLIDYRPEHDYIYDHHGRHDYAKQKFWVIDSCNGLLLYRSMPEYNYFSSAVKYNFYICNPITHDYLKLPTFEQEEREQRFNICKYSPPNIVFDPLVSLTYKVVIWLICKDRKTIYSSNWKWKWKGNGEEYYRFYVYSSETRSWQLNQIKDPSIFSFDILERGVLCNGVLYWSTKYPCFQSNLSLRYDVEKDVISTLNFPKMPPEYNDRVLLYFGECGGRLRLIETYYTELNNNDDVCPFIFDVTELDCPFIFDVMELDNNDDSWTVKYRVNIGVDQLGYFAKLVGKERYSKFSVHIMDIYKTKTKKAAGEHEIHQGDEEEEEEELLLDISKLYIIPFNLSSNTFGKELRHGKKKLVRDDHNGYMDMGFNGFLRYNTITLFPPSTLSS